ncbi:MULTISPECIES: LysR substrate-binding domain-containing protein [unclassified Rhodococcus (in: high G+C Gram-positive bacteria)]|uniref:LysR substrate-binding domain-containing protein n=1 Tax=unclassified Rhodococcus (in: high G+C Gram-positive bacteria) TaxID=192944 RepID=UPI00146DB932|nr:LysR substrate-binding domain-containing protein [Rhodococcus sp. BL-253-APC-6A1W]NMD96282.1 LysR family transcriptional regulator [Rhodococcus sp. BL-253-APC-6A1W]
MDRFLSDETASVVPLLAAFDAAAREGHITHAADRLGVPQSSVSRRIKALEHTMGVSLFQQIGRGVALTTAGRELHARTRETIRELDDAINTVRSHADPDSGIVRFGFPLTLGPVSVPSLLAEFHRDAPRIRLHLVQAHGEALAAMVRDGRLDLAVMIPPPEDLVVTVLGSQPLLLHVADTHPLAERDRVDLGELADEHFIAGPPTYHVRTELDNYCRAAGFDPYIAFEISEFDTIRALVAQGLGIALLPRAEIPQPGVATVHVSGIADRPIGLATGTRHPSPAALRLHTHVTTRAQWPPEP